MGTVEINMLLQQYRDASVANWNHMIYIFTLILLGQLEYPMPTRIDTLYNALMLAIIEYCDTKTDTSFMVGESELSLEELITSAMSTNGDDDVDRTSLMKYILYVVNQLKPLVAKKTILDDSAAIDLQQQLIQFVLDIQLALSQSKTTQITVRYGDQDHVLFGCFLILRPCKSGGIIQRQLFEALKLPVNAAKEAITEYVTNAINAHQCPLLRQANKHLKALNKQLLIAPLLTTEPHFRTPELLSAQEEIKRLRQLLDNANSHISATAKSADIPVKRIDGSAFSLGWYNLFSSMAKPVDPKQSSETSDREVNQAIPTNTPMLTK